MHRNTRIFITGYGVISAIGVGKDETLRALRQGRSGIGAIEHLRTTHTDLPSGEVHLTNAQLAMRAQTGSATTSRTVMMAVIALREAIEQARLTADDMRRAILLSGTTVGNFDAYEDHFLTLKKQRPEPQHRLFDCGSSTEQLADAFGQWLLKATVSTACSSAANAFVLGANLLRSGMADVAVVGGAECISRFHLNGFNSLMILDHGQCRPFDACRAGLNLGEGAAYMVLETGDHARRRGAQPLACLSGYGNACDAFHQTATSTDGEGAFLAMRKALRMAGLQPSDIDYVNAHGTGTPDNDASENRALRRLFGNALPPVSSTKGFTGHTTSASGAVEAVICLLALRHAFLPANYGFTSPMPDGIVPVAHTETGRKLRHVLCNSFGFGGNDTSIILSWYTLSQQHR